MLYVEQTIHMQIMTGKVWSWREGTMGIQIFRCCCPGQKLQKESAIWLITSSSYVLQIIPVCRNMRGNGLQEKWSVFMQDCQKKLSVRLSRIFLMKKQEKNFLLCWMIRGSRRNCYRRWTMHWQCCHWILNQWMKLMRRNYSYWRKYISMWKAAIRFSQHRKYQIRQMA